MADNIIFLYKEDSESDEITLKLAKQRAGQTGKIKLKFKKESDKYIKRKGDKNE